MKKAFTPRLLLLAIASIVTATGAWAQVTWNFTAATATPSATATNITTSDLVQGNNNGTTGFIGSTSPSNVYTGASGTNNAGLAARTGVLNTAVGSSAYVEFTLTPAAGYFINLTAISFGTRSTSTGPQAYALRTSLDAYASDQATGSITNNSVWVLKSNTGLNISGATNTAITFRIYGYAGTGNAAASTANWRLDDIALTVTAVSAVSSNANLSALAISNGTLAPVFASDSITYTTTVTNSVSSVTVTPTAAQANATIKINGTTVASGSASPAIALAVGSNTITVVVTAQDGTTTKTYTITVTRTAAGTPTLSATALAAFGAICTNTTAGPNSFTLDGTDLDGSAITIAALAGYQFSETSGGTYTSTLSFTYTGSGFTGKVIYVKFTPAAVQSYNGNITLSGGVSSYAVPVSGSGVNTLATVVTNPATGLSSSATLNGSITTVGCGPVTKYGFLYDTASAFPNFTASEAVATNLAGGNFSAVISNLTANKRYYYKAYVISGTDTSFGAQQAFNAPPQPVVLSAQPSLTFTETFADIANWKSFFAGGLGSEHFSQAPLGTGSVPAATVVTSNAVFSTGSSGGIQRGTDQVAPLTPTQSIVLLSTGSPDNTTSAAFDFFMDFAGLNAGTLSFDYQTLNNGGATDNRNGSLRVYASVNGTTFTEVTNILSFTNNSPISGSKTNIALPAIFNNSSTARLRFYYYNGEGATGSGARPKISIDNITVTAVATAICATPTAMPTALVFGTTTDVSIAGSFTAASPAADQYLVVASTSSTLTSNPVNGQIYSVGDNVGDGTVVARGSGTGFTATGLSASTLYYFFIFPVNAVCTGGPLYNTTAPLTGQQATTAGLPPCTAPSAQATSLVFSNVTTNAIQGSFTAAASASEYLVVRSTSATLSQTPVSGQAYNAGDLIGNGVVVQRNGNLNFSTTSLASNTTYYFFVFSANAQACINGPAYNTTAPLTGQQATQPLPPCATPSLQPYNLALNASNTAIAGNFAPVSGADAYLVVRSTASTLSATPADNTDYAIGSTLGGGVVIGNSSANTFQSVSLTPGTTYYYFVFAANKACSGGTKYLTATPLTGSKATLSLAAYSYYFGTLHSHSDYSDGNQDNPGYTPAMDYNYALSAQCMDFLGISEHNHFSSPDNPGNKVGTYHQGITQATDFTAAHPSFLALYGMEWGVISGGGHVVVYGNGMDDLFGWESGSGDWGPGNNYDVYVPKSVYTGNTGLFKTILNYKAQNTFASLAHPNLTDYNNLANGAYNAVADSAISATAVESGPATSSNTSYSNPGSSLFYLWYYQTLLAKGYHLGPVMDHDNHRTTFGKTTYSRTAVVAPALTKAELMAAMHDMHFYATQDCDSKVDFSINTRMMGSLFTDRYAPMISVTLTDATTPTTGAIIRLMFGQPGSGVLPVQLDSAIGNTFTYSDINLANGATGYYYIDISNGSSRIVTSPIWYTRNDNNGIVLPVKLVQFGAEKRGAAVGIDWTTATETNAKEFVVERATDGQHFSRIAVVAAKGNGAPTTNYTALDNNPSAVNYYRLRSVDVDGKSEVSKVVRVTFDKAVLITLLPNPATDRIQVTIADYRGPAPLQMMDASGKVVKAVTLTGTSTPVDVSALAKGLYIVQLKTNGSLFSQKLIIQ